MAPLEAAGPSTWLLLLLLALLPSALAACEDSNVQCTGWAELGECEVNSRVMQKACPRSCLFCDPHGDVGYCRDKRAECSHWLSIGLCQRNPQAMLEACPLACDTCDEAAEGNAPPTTAAMMRLGAERRRNGRHDGRRDGYIARSRGDLQAVGGKHDEGGGGGGGSGGRSNGGDYYGGGAHQHVATFAAGAGGGRSDQDRPATEAGRDGHDAKEGAVVRCEDESASCER